MKICFIAPRIIPPWNDGLKNSLIDLASGLSQLGAEITIVTSAPYYEIPKTNKMFFYKDVRIIVYPYYLPQTIFGSLIPEALQVSLNILYHVPKINKKHNFDILHSHSGATLYSVPTLILKKLLKIPALHTLHGLTYSKIGSSKYIQKLLTKFDEVTVTTQVQYEHIKNFIPTVKIVPDGLCIDNFYPLIKKEKEDIYEKLNTELPIVGFIGPLIERKGFHNFLVISKDLITEYPEIKFLIMNSSSEELIKKQIKGIEDHFVFTGYVENRNKIINCMDIIVFPFDYINETLGQPIAMLESMACGKSIVVTDVNGISELVTHNKNGLLCQQYNLETMRKQILELIRNAEKRKKLGNSAMATANKYNIKNTAKQIYSIYEEILQKGEI